MGGWSPYRLVLLTLAGSLLVPLGLSAPGRLFLLGLAGPSLPAGPLLEVPPARGVCPVGLVNLAGVIAGTLQKGFPA